MTIRSDLKTAIAAATTGVNVYDHLADVVAYPAAVVHRLRTYPKTTGQNNLEHEIDVHVLVQRSDPAQAEDLAESICMDIAVALESPFRWDEFSGVTLTQYNQIDTAEATVRIIAKE